jgi:hypothetical protein
MTDNSTRSPPKRPSAQSAAHDTKLDLMVRKQKRVLASQEAAMLAQLKR